MGHIDGTDERGGMNWREWHRSWDAVALNEYWEICAVFEGMTTHGDGNDMMRVTHSATSRFSQPSFSESLICVRAAFNCSTNAINFFFVALTRYEAWKYSNIPRLTKLFGLQNHPLRDLPAKRNQKHRKKLKHNLIKRKKETRMKSGIHRLCIYIKNFFLIVRSER